MIYLISTKRGIGVELWGNYEDLNNLYEFIGRFWNWEDYLDKPGFESRDKLLSFLSYEVRKAKDGIRLKRNFSHFSRSESQYYGAQFSWVYILFALTALKFNMRFHDTTKYDVAQVLQIEFWLEKAMNEYDMVGAKNLVGFIDDGLCGANNNIYQYMRSINLDFYLLRGGKIAFRKLPELLKKGIFFTKEYKEYEIFLQTEAKRHNCQISELELDDGKFNYEAIKW